MNMGNDPNSRLPKLHDHTTSYVKEINILRSYDAQNAGRYTQSIYKFILGLNETGGTFLAYPSISKYVWTTTN